MVDIIRKWINDSLGLPMPHFDDPELFRKYFANGYLAGEILRKYNVISDDQSISLTKSHSALSRSNNMGKIYQWLTNEGLKINPNIFQDIIDEKPGAGMKFLYQLFLWLESPKSYKLAGFNFTDNTLARELSIRTDLASFHVVDRPDEDEWLQGLVDYEEKLDDEFQKRELFEEEKPLDTKTNALIPPDDMIDLTLKDGERGSQEFAINQMPSRPDSEQEGIIEEVQKKVDKIPIFTKIKNPCIQVYDDKDEYKEFIFESEKTSRSINFALLLKKEKCSEKNSLEKYFEIKDNFGFESLERKKLNLRRSRKVEEQMEALKELEDYDKKLNIFEDDPDFIPEPAIWPEELNFKVYKNGQGDSCAMERSLNALQFRLKEEKARANMRNKREKKFLEEIQLQRQLEIVRNQRDLIYKMTMDISAPERRLAGFILMNDRRNFTDHKIYEDQEILKLGYRAKLYEERFCDDDWNLTTEQLLSLKNQEMENLQNLLKKEDNENSDFVNCILDGLVNMADLVGQIRDLIRPPTPPPCTEQFPGECEGEGFPDEFNLMSGFELDTKPTVEFTPAADVTTGLNESLRLPTNSFNSTNLTRGVIQEFQAHENGKKGKRTELDVNISDWIESGRLPPPTTPKAEAEFMNEEESIASAPVYGNPKTKFKKSSNSMK